MEPTISRIILAVEFASGVWGRFISHVKSDHGGEGFDGFSGFVFIIAIVAAGDVALGGVGHEDGFARTLPVWRRRAIAFSV
jgi:hypothetical protein